MIEPPAWQAGMEITSERLTARDEFARSGRVVVAAGSGLVGTFGADGAHLDATRAPEGWFRVSAAASPTGWYTLVEQLDQVGGTWVDGKVIRVAREANLNANVPVGASGTGAVVRAFRGRSRWNFAYSKCS